MKLGLVGCGSWGGLVKSSLEAERPLRAQEEIRLEL